MIELTISKPIFDEINNSIPIPTQTFEIKKEDMMISDWDNMKYMTKMKLSKMDSGWIVNGFMYLMILVFVLVFVFYFIYLKYSGDSFL